MSEEEIIIDVNDRLPKNHRILYVILDDGSKVKSYFYTDKISWISFYGQKTSYFWHHRTGEPLFNVTHWIERKGKDEKAP